MDLDVLTLPIHGAFDATKHLEEVVRSLVRAQPQASNRAPRTSSYGFHYSEDEMDIGLPFIVEARLSCDQCHDMKAL